QYPVPGDNSRRVDQIARTLADDHFEIDRGRFGENSPGAQGTRTEHRQGAADHHLARGPSSGPGAHYAQSAEGLQRGRIRIRSEDRRWRTGVGIIPMMSLIAASIASRGTRIALAVFALAVIIPPSIARSADKDAGALEEARVHWQRGRIDESLEVYE